MRWAKDRGEKVNREASEKRRYVFRLDGNVYQKGYSEIVSMRDIWIELFHHLRWNWKERSEQRFGIGIDIGSGNVVVPLDLLCVIVVGIYKRSFTSNTTVLAELAEARFERDEWVASFKKMSDKRGGSERSI